MFLKIMSAEDAADSDSRKSFHLLAHVASVDFERQDDGTAKAAVMFLDGDVESFDVTGNAYVMNDAGKTVASFGVSPPH